MLTLLNKHAITQTRIYSHFSDILCIMYPGDEGNQIWFTIYARQQECCKFSMRLAHVPREFRSCWRLKINKGGVLTFIELLPRSMIQSLLLTVLAGQSAAQCPAQASEIPSADRRMSATA